MSPQNPLFTLLLSLLLTTSLAHTFLTDPEAYNRVFQLRDCTGKQCKQACPSFQRNPSRQANSASRPARTWARGQTVRIRWARNNHNNGFIRFAIVPVNVMMSRAWHTRLSLYHGCFSQGSFRCRGEKQCGSDKSNLAYQRSFRVPTIYPDGDYIFAMVWYGGARGPVNRAPKFSDYFSCSFVRIQGGSLGGKFKPFFETGVVEVTPKTVKGKCLSAVNAPGVCSRFGCKRRADWKVPRGFQRGAARKRLGVSDVVEARRA